MSLKKNKPANWEHSEGNKTIKNYKGTVPFETAILLKQTYSATIQHRQIYAKRSQYHDKTISNYQ